ESSHKQHKDPRMQTSRQCDGQIPDAHKSPKSTQTGWAVGASAGRPETKNNPHRVGGGGLGRKARNKNRVQAGDHEVVPSRHRVQVDNHEVVPSRHRVQVDDHEVVPSRHRVQVDNHEVVPSRHRVPAGDHEVVPSRHRVPGGRRRSRGGLRREPAGRSGGRQRRVEAPPKNCGTPEAWSLANPQWRAQELRRRPDPQWLAQELRRRPDPQWREQRLT
ncbi:hypothetical protein ILYODFUR_038073, partial [Ilyodon furcidens]